MPKALHTLGTEPSTFNMNCNVRNFKEKFSQKIKKYFIFILYDMVRTSSDKCGKISVGITFSTYRHSLVIQWHLLVVKHDSGENQARLYLTGHRTIITITGNILRLHVLLRANNPDGNTVPCPDVPVICTFFLQVMYSEPDRRSVPTNSPNETINVKIIIIQPVTFFGLIS